MNTNYDESCSNFSFEFSGDTSIYAETLSKTIENIVESLQFITAQKEPDAYFKLKITKFRQNSFDIDLRAIIQYLPKIFNKENIDLASGIVTILLGAFEIKKHLKGEKAQKIEYDKKMKKGTVINKDGESLTKDVDTVKLYFEDNHIETNIVNIFNVLKQDDLRSDLRSDLKICNGDKEVIKIEKTEFENMSKRTVDIKEEAIEVFQNEVSTELLLKKPDLLGDSQWGFVYNKNIYATIKDNSWLDKVHNGKIRNLYAGVRIPVKLLIEIELDKNHNPIKDSDKYTVLEVTGDIIEPENVSQISFYDKE